MCRKDDTAKMYDYNEILPNCTFKIEISSIDLYYTKTLFSFSLLVYIFEALLKLL